MKKNFYKVKLWNNYTISGHNYDKLFAGITFDVFEGRGFEESNF